MERVMPSPALLWLAAGLIIIALEILVPGFVIFWFGLGAVITSICVFAGVPSDGTFPWIIFLCSSLLFLLLWHLYFKKHFGKNLTEESRDPTLLNLRGIAKTAIEPHRSGEVELYSVYHSLKVWKAESEESIPEGSEIEVIESRGIKLLVKKINGGK